MSARSGDWIFGDVDGVVVIPSAQSDARFRAALDKVPAEDRTRAVARDRCLIAYTAPPD